MIKTLFSKTIKSYVIQYVLLIPMVLVVISAIDYIAYWSESSVLVVAFILGFIWSATWDLLRDSYDY